MQKVHLPIKAVPGVCKCVYMCVSMSMCVKDGGWGMDKKT